MLFLNSGGTLNKRYNPLNGELEIPVDNMAIEKILLSISDSLNIAGVIYKDSLDMDMNDRKVLASIIMESKEDTFIIVHGTDTMELTAEFLDGVFDDRKIILVGSMQPFEIEPIESSVNIGMAIGFAKAVNECGVYICMSGFVEFWDKIQKNRLKGKFELV